MPTLTQSPRRNPIQETIDHLEDHPIFPCPAEFIRGGLRYAEQKIPTGTPADELLERLAEVGLTDVVQPDEWSKHHWDLTSEGRMTLNYLARLQ